MYELLVALKYLVPRKKQLSVSIISLISAFVIALVVWLILVFFSVTNGLERNWTEKLVSLTAPVRITPTPAYYNSYYYRVDSIAENSDYSSKSLREKLSSDFVDPYDPDSDEEIPHHWPSKDIDSEGEVKDLVKEAVRAAELAGGEATPFETSVAQLRLNIKRGGKMSTMSQSAYLASLDKENRDIRKAFIKPEAKDAENRLLNGIAAEDFEILKLKALENYRIPATLFPSEGKVDLLIVRKGTKDLYGYLVTKDGLKQELEEQWNSWGAEIAEEQIDFSKESTLPLYLPAGTELEVKSAQQGEFLVKVGQFQGKVPLDGLTISECCYKEKDGYLLTSIGDSEAILLPKSFKEAGVLAGDEGIIAYYLPTTSTMQEQRIPVVVAGFYDQGIVPIGGRLVMARPELVSTVMNAYDSAESSLMSGIDVRLADYNAAEDVKEQIISELESRGVAQYWDVQTYREYPFTKDLLQQLRSEKNLFSLISVVIILVACSNIISMLIILVNDKKVEIGILRSMGASSTSIATIFAICGLTMGFAGSLIGVVFAVLTLNNLESLVAGISYLQGHELFNSQFFGEVIPNELSPEALMFVVTATIILSLISGIVPALKACMLKPSQILRADG